MQDLPLAASIILTLLSAGTRILIARHFYAITSESYFPSSPTLGGVFEHTKATTLTSVRVLCISKSFHPK